MHFCAHPFSSLLKGLQYRHANVKNLASNYYVKKALKEKKKPTRLSKSFPLELCPYGHSVNAFKIVVKKKNVNVGLADSGKTLCFCRANNTQHLGDKDTGVVSSKL